LERLARKIFRAARKKLRECRRDVVYQALGVDRPEPAASAILEGADQPPLQHVPAVRLRYAGWRRHRRTLHEISQVQARHCQAP